MSIFEILAASLVKIAQKKNNQHTYKHKQWVASMIGTGELLVILSIVLVLFGGKRLPEIAKNLGRGIREFKKACQGTEDEEVEIIEVKPKQEKGRDPE